MGPGMSLFEEDSFIDQHIGLPLGIIEYTTGPQLPSEAGPSATYHVRLNMRLSSIGCAVYMTGWLFMMPECVRLSEIIADRCVPYHRYPYRYNAFMAIVTPVLVMGWPIVLGGRLAYNYMAK